MVPLEQTRCIEVNNHELIKIRFRPQNENAVIVSDHGDPRSKWHVEIWVPKEFGECRPSFKFDGLENPTAVISLAAE